MAGLIGYARVSTGGQSVQRQVDELRKACCAEIVEEPPVIRRASTPIDISNGLTSRYCRWWP